MKNLSNPRWILLVNTLPSIILALLSKSQYDLIKSALDAESLLYWKIFSLVFFVISLASAAYAGILVYRKKKVHFLYAITSFVGYTTFIYLYIYHAEKFFPRSLPRWTFDQSPILLVGTFLMPTLAYAFFILVTKLHPKDKKLNLCINLSGLILIPALFYVFGVVIFPLWNFPSGEIFMHLLIVLVLLGTMLFLFFLVSIVLLIVQRITPKYPYQLLWRIPLALVFPLAGLALNNGQIVSDINNAFGDFSNPWFYILAAINGILLCLPSLEKTSYRRLLFFGRCMTFPFTVYFFIVFLPFLPLSVIGLLAFGLGFLMLTPLLLLPIHVREIIRDLEFLKQQSKGLLRQVILVFGVSVIPAILTLSFLNNKATLNDALDYVYNPDYSKDDYRLDTTAISRAINSIEKNKQQTDPFNFFDRRIPYISSYYKWIVLDGLTLSRDKISHIENIFWGTPTSMRDRRGVSTKDDVVISNIGSSQTYDKKTGIWRSWVDLELTNRDKRWQSEYSTTFELPEGCWISDYYLYVNERKEPGLLVERKSALWVYTQIVNEKKDPGILYYLTGNKVAFKVFPFTRGEVRRTGIEFIHKDPVTLNIDGNAITLGEPIADTNPVSTDYAIYISPEKKRQLKKVQRKPYLHFIIDTSRDKKKKLDDYAGLLDAFIKENPDSAKNARISFTNTYVSTIPLNAQWKETYRAQSFEGGFFLDRAIRKALFDAYTKNGNSYPVLIVLTESGDNPIIEKDFADFHFAYPEGPRFFMLQADGRLATHFLNNSPRTPQNSSANHFGENIPVLAYEKDACTHYLPNDGKPSIIPRKDLFEISQNEIFERDWNSALALQAQHRSQILHPEQKDKHWLNAVQSSFKTKIMTPRTSYIVVETEGQRVALLMKQKQVLAAGKQNLDTDEVSQKMSEPELSILAGLLGFFIWIRKRKKK